VELSSVLDDVFKRLTAAFSKFSRCSFRALILYCGYYLLWGDIVGSHLARIHPNSNGIVLTPSKDYGLHNSRNSLDLRDNVDLCIICKESLIINLRVFRIEVDYHQQTVLLLGGCDSRLYHFSG